MLLENKTREHFVHKWFSSLASRITVVFYVNPEPPWWLLIYALMTLDRIHWYIKSIRTMIWKKSKLLMLSYISKQKWEDLIHSTTLFLFIIQATSDRFNQLICKLHPKCCSYSYFRPDVELREKPWGVKWEIRINFHWIKWEVYV